MGNLVFKTIKKSLPWGKYADRKSILLAGCLSTGVMMKAKQVLIGLATGCNSFFSQLPFGSITVEEKGDGGLKNQKENPELGFSFCTN